MQDPRVEVPGELRRLATLLEQLEALGGGGPAVLDLRVPAVSGWSVAQHLYHVALATDLSLGNVRSLVRGSGMLVRAEGALGERAAEVLGRDLQPRGVAEAPRMVRPGDRVDPTFLAREQAGNRALLAELAADPAAIEAAAGWVPHQELGTLRAAHWLRFSALHARHHLAIVEDLRAAR